MNLRQRLKAEAADKVARGELTEEAAERWYFRTYEDAFMATFGAKIKNIDLSEFEGR